MSGITPAKRRRWSERLAGISARPLAYCPQFPDIARRWEAWWRFDADRPLLLASAHKRDDIRWSKAFDLVDDPAEWLRVRRLQVESTHYVGESIPSIRADIGPVTIAAFLGAPLHLAEPEQTSWQKPIIDCWDDAPDLSELDARNPWLARVLELLSLVAIDGASRYVACLPDLTGAIDALSNLRGPERLCLDLFEHRDRIVRHSLQLVDAWEQAYTLMHDLVLKRGTGVVHSLGCWSMIPHTLPSCDFNALIGTRDFEETCLPSLREQASRAGRCILHVDGPQAARHAKAIAAVAEITAVQYQPGAGTPSALAKLGMLKLLQEHGKPVYVSCPADEVERLAGELDPRGLVLQTDPATPARADELARIVSRFHAK